nr:replication initiator protein A [uncultured Oscillibacter sp.]
MPEIILSDYFYGDESEEFVFFKIPRQLITNPKFKHVSTDAKLLYGMLLDRMSLSARNGWYDDTGRVYIYYSVDEICGDMTCGRDKAMKLLAELDTKKGVGLIERIKQGQGKPTRIYVKRFTTRTAPPKPAPPPPEPFAPISEVGFPDLQKSEIPTSRGRKNRLPEVEKTDPNYTKRIQTELIHPGRGPSAEVFSRCVHDAPGDRGKRL